MITPDPPAGPTPFTFVVSFSPNSLAHVRVLRMARLSLYSRRSDVFLAHLVNSGGHSPDGPCFASTIFHVAASRISGRYRFLYNCSFHTAVTKTDNLVPTSFTRVAILCSLSFFDPLSGLPFSAVQPVGLENSSQKETVVESLRLPPSQVLRSVTDVNCLSRR